MEVVWIGPNICFKIFQFLLPWAASSFHWPPLNIGACYSSLVAFAGAIARQLKDALRIDATADSKVKHFWTLKTGSSRGFGTRGTSG